MCKYGVTDGVTDGRAQKGLPLTAVNLLVLPVVVGCTSLVTALGVTALAAHTIVKQVCSLSPLEYLVDFLLLSSCWPLILGICSE